MRGDRCDREPHWAHTFLSQYATTQLNCPTPPKPLRSVVEQLGGVSDVTERHAFAAARGRARERDFREEMNQKYPLKAALVVACCCSRSRSQECASWGGWAVIAGDAYVH